MECLASRGLSVTGVGDVGALGWEFTAQPGARGPSPACMGAAGPCASIWHSVVGPGLPGQAWVGLGLRWRAGGLQSSRWPGASLCPACCTPHLQVQADSEAQWTLESSWVAGVGPPIPSVLQTRRLRCPGWAYRIVLSAPGLPCGGAGRDRPGWQGLSRAPCGTSRGPWGQNGRPVWSCHWGVAGRDMDTEARPFYQSCSVHVRDGPASLGETPVCCGRLRTQGGVVRKGRERGWTEDTWAQPHVFCARGALLHVRPSICWQ